MSSPAMYRGQSSPASRTPHGGYEEEEDADSELPHKLLQVKILYTFADDSRVNCLARISQPTKVPIVQLDSTTQIGVIELKKCIEAIVRYSPEIVGKLDGLDYTVYAYDFSEYETPLVGQGMLSWVLASASPTPNAPAHESQTMITGRVCKNIIGMFTKGSAPETLEVKLKMVPVPKVVQKEYLDSMEQYRNLSKAIPADVDPNTWGDFVRENPNLGNQAPQEIPQSFQPRAQHSNSRDIEATHVMPRQDTFGRSLQDDRASFDLQQRSLSRQNSFMDSPSDGHVATHESQQRSLSRRNSFANASVSGQAAQDEYNPPARPRPRPKPFANAASKGHVASYESQQRSLSRQNSFANAASSARATRDESNRLTTSRRDSLANAASDGHVASHESQQRSIARQNSYANSMRDDHPHDYDFRQRNTQDSRAASPTPSFRSSSGFPQHVPDSNSRPGSRASVRGERHLLPRPEPSEVDPKALNETFEDGPQRKRARITQATKADWDGKSQFSSKVDSLRVTASTANSVRVVRPTPLAPAQAVSESLEAPPRAPTPRPGDANGPLLRGRIARPSLLRTTSLRYNSPYGGSPLDGHAGSEPDTDLGDLDQAESIAGTPQEFPSSPPVARYDNSPTPSSPQLPPLPYQSDSGFASDLNLDTEEPRGKKRRKRSTNIDREASSCAPAPNKKDPMQWNAVMPGPVNKLPKQVRIAQSTIDKQAKEAEKELAGIVVKKKSMKKGKSNTLEPSSSAAPIPTDFLVPSADALSGFYDSSMVGLHPFPPPMPYEDWFSTQGSDFPPIGDELAGHMTFMMTDIVTTQQEQQVIESAKDTEGLTPNASIEPEISAVKDTQEQPQQEQVDRAEAKQKDREASQLAEERGQSGELGDDRAVSEDPISQPRPHPEVVNPSRPTSREGSNQPVGDASITSGSKDSTSASEKEPHSGSGRRARRAAAHNLENAVASGVMPRYCHNCGQIKTCTWRRAYCSTHPGPPEEIQVSKTFKTDDGIAGFELISNEDGKSTKQYRIFKKTVNKKDKEGWNVIQLCNPCGLYFDKWGRMRPQNFWKERLEKASTSTPEDTTDAADDSRRDTSSAEDQKMGSIADDTHEPPSVRHQDSVMSDAPSEFMLDVPEAPPPRHARANSVTLPVIVEDEPLKKANAAAVAALQRAIQSSPARFLGSKQSPIEVEPDLTPKPTRRLLFPSPRKDGQKKSLEEGSKEPSVSSHVAVTSGTRSPTMSNRAAPKLAQDCDKENMPPVGLDEDDQLSYLFGDEPPKQPATPKATTPEAKMGSLMDAVMKTPIVEKLLRTPGGKLRSRDPLTPRQPNTDNVLAGLGIDTPSRTANQTMTPFTAQLTAIMSDPNFQSSPSRPFDFSALMNLGTQNAHNDYLNIDWTTNTYPADFGSDPLFSDVMMPDGQPFRIWDEYEATNDIFEEPAPEKALVANIAEINAEKATLLEEKGKDGAMSGEESTTLQEKSAVQTAEGSSNTSEPVAAPTNETAAVIA